jgi:hypothetical protein
VALHPRVRKTFELAARRRGIVRVRAEANFPAREAEAHERPRDRYERYLAWYDAYMNGNKPATTTAGAAAVM